MVISKVPVVFERYKGVKYIGYILIYKFVGKPNQTKKILCLPDLGIEYDFTNDSADGFSHNSKNAKEIDKIR